MSRHTIFILSAGLPIIFGATPLRAEYLPDEYLMEAVKLAIHSYPSIRSAESSRSAAKLDVRVAKREQLPSLTVEALATNTVSNSGPIDLALALEQPLWAGGRITGQIKQAEARLEGADAKIYETALDVALKTTSAYVEVQRLARRQIILHESLEEHQNLVGSMERRVKYEVSPTSDLSLARSRAFQVAQDISQVTAAKEAAQNRLKELAGSDILVRPFDIKMSNFLSPDEIIIDEAVKFSPVRRRFEAEARSAAAEVQIKRGESFPQLNLQYYRSIDGDSRVGVVLRGQTGGGLSRLSSVGAAARRREAADSLIEVAESETRDAVISDLLEYRSAKDRIGLTSSAAMASIEVTASFMRQFTAGKRTWFDVLNAVREATAAKLSEVDAQTSLVAAYSRLLLRTGLWRLPVRTLGNQK